MEVIMIDKDSYYKLMEESFSLMYKVVHQKIKEEKEKGACQEKERLNTKEAMEFLGTKNRNLLYRLRNDKKISYYQIGKSVQYCKKSLIRFVEAHKIQ